MNHGPQLLLRVLDRERTARKAAESLLESKSRELFDALAEQKRLRLIADGQVDHLRLLSSEVEQTLSETLAALNAGFWEVNLGTGAFQWSERASLLHGVERYVASGSHDAWRACVHPADYDQMMGTQSSQEAPNSISDYRVVLNDGTVRWLRSSNTTSFSPKKTPLLMRGIVTDITAARALDDQLARLAELASRTSNAVIVAELDGTIAWVNEGFTRMTGWPSAEVIGKRPGQLLQGPDTDRATVAKFREALAAREPVELELLNYRKDGEQFWVHIELRVSRNTQGQPTGFIAVESDVTEQRSNERKDRLAERIAALLLASGSLEKAVADVTRALVSELDIRTAQLWVVEGGRNELVYLAGAASEPTGRAGHDFLGLSRSLAFVRSTDKNAVPSIPGQAWALTHSILINELSAASQTGPASRRETAAAAAGVVTVCATPILGPSGVLGILEVGGTRTYPGHALIPRLLERVCEQLAAFILQEQSRRAFMAVFEQAPDAMLVVNSFGHVESMNARATALFGSPTSTPVDTLIEGASDLIAAARADDANRGQTLPVNQLWTRTAHSIAGEFSAELSVATIFAPTAPATIISVRDLTERHRIDGALTASLREKEVLLREVHHRVKNNLQIVSSLVSLQADRLEPNAGRDALAETAHRVRAMALVHEQLYGTTNLSTIDVSQYARELTSKLIASLDPSAALTIEADPVELSIDKAVPWALILNELVTNALKHGRSADGQCRIHLTLRATGDEFSMSITDQGAGFPPAPPAASTLGLQGVQSLVRQLRARVVMATRGGAQVTMHVPLTQ